MENTLEDSSAAVFLQVEDTPSRVLARLDPRRQAGGELLPPMPQIID